jgi:hypothetical protein
VFGINTPLQFFQKLLQEFDDCFDHPGSARHAMNFVITAHHLAEWVWKGFLKDDEAKQKQLGITKKNLHAYRAWLETQSIWVAQMQALANGSKHFQPGGLPITLQTVGAYGTVAYNELAFADLRSWLAIDMGSLEGRPYLVPAVDIFEAVVRFWRDFLRAHGPYPSLPVGKTKLSTP